MLTTEAAANFRDGCVDSLHDFLRALVPQGVIDPLHGLVTEGDHLVANPAGLVALQACLDAGLGFRQARTDSFATFAADFVAHPLDQAVEATPPASAALVFRAHGVTRYDGFVAQSLLRRLVLPSRRRTLESSPMSTPRRIAVIEVNHWHSTYDAAYLTVLQNLDLDIELVGVSDSDAAIAEDRARRYETTAFTDYRQMIDATKPEFVIALGRHVEMPEIAGYLIEAGIPFMMEKPMGTSAGVVSGLADLAEARGAWVSVPFPNRQSPWAAKAREMIAADEFGAISHIVFRIIRPTMQRYVEWDSPWMLDRSQAGGGALTNLGGHGMDMSRFLLGEDVQVASAVISNIVHASEVEDYALATLRSSSGTLVHVEVGYTMPTWPANESDSEMKVAGANAMLQAVPDGLQILAPGRNEHLDTPVTVLSAYPGFVRDCLERVGRGDPPAITPRDCANAVQLIDDAYRAAGRV